MIKHCYISFNSSVHYVPIFHNRTCDVTSWAEVINTMQIQGLFVETSHAHIPGTGSVSVLLLTLVQNRQWRPQSFVIWTKPIKIRGRSCHYGITVPTLWLL